MLSVRLKKVMYETISISQNAFVESGRILDAIFVVNEVVDSRKKQGVLGVFASQIMKRPMM